MFSVYVISYENIERIFVNEIEVFVRSIERATREYFSIIGANIIRQYYHSRFKIATIIRGNCEGQTRFPRYFDFGVGKVVHLPRSNIQLSKCMLCWPSLIDRDSTRTMLLGCRMLEMTEVKHRRCSNYSTRLRFRAENTFNQVPSVEDSLWENRISPISGVEIDCTFYTSKIN